MVKKTLIALLCGMTGGVAALILVAAVHLEKRTDLKLWHEAYLDAEFRADSAVSDLEGYLALEETLFRQLERQVLDRLPPTDRGPVNRYQRGSLTDPGRWERNWNRTFELASAGPAAGVLLLHGMSDAPYSLRAIGTELNAKGAWVLGLRLPGHGTVPSGLVRVTWEDMASAVRLAMRHLRERVGDKPLFMIGYSTGGALAVEYTLTQLDRPALPAVEKIVLISPAIRVTRLAALSVWQGRIGRWLGADKLAWNSIQPEYNSYKYNSFAINAGVQVHRLTTTLQQRLAAVRRSDKRLRFPPVQTFQSVVDATVSTPAVITDLYRHLTNQGDELVLFDINRRSGVLSLLATDPLDPIQALLEPEDGRYRITLVTNQNPNSSTVVDMPLKGGAPTAAILPWRWPEGVHSLAHIALPFPADDPLYGEIAHAMNPGIALSRVVLRGEKNVLQIPADEILRMRWNPFYPYLSLRMMAFLGL